MALAPTRECNWRRGASSAQAVRARARSPSVRALVLFETVWTGPMRPLIDCCSGVAAPAGAMLSAGMKNLIEAVFGETFASEMPARLFVRISYDACRLDVTH
jgi:hypothetical protein